MVSRPLKTVGNGDVAGDGASSSGDECGGFQALGGWRRHMKTDDSGFGRRIGVTGLDIPDHRT